MGILDEIEKFEKAEPEVEEINPEKDEEDTDTEEEETCRLTRDEHPLKSTRLPKMTIAPSTLG